MCWCCTSYAFLAAHKDRTFSLVRCGAVRSRTPFLIHDLYLFFESGTFFSSSFFLPLSCVFVHLITDAARSCMCCVCTEGVDDMDNLARMCALDHKLMFVVRLSSDER